MGNNPTSWMDPANLEQILQMLAATEEQRKAARGNAIAQMGFAMLGAPKGSEWQAFGRAGLGGMQAYQDNLAGARAENMDRFKLRDYLTQRSRTEEDYQTKKRRERELEEARKAGVVPAHTESMFPAVAKDDEGGAMPAYASRDVPQSYDWNKYVNALAPVDPAAALQAKTQMAKESPLDKPKPEHYTPASIQKFLATGNYADLEPITKPADPVVGKLNPADFDPASVQAFIASGGRDYSLLKLIDKRATTTINMPAQQTAFQKQVGEDLGKDYATLQVGARKAGTKMQTLSAIAALLNGIDTGKATPAMAEIAGWAKSLGVTIDANLGPKQAAEAISNALALEARSPSGGAGMPGALSDRDREFLVKMTPNLSQTPEGRRLLIEVHRRLAMREQEVARYAREYRKMRGGEFDEGFYDYLEQKIGGRGLFADLMQRTSPRETGGQINGSNGGGVRGGNRVVDFNTMR